MLVFHLKCCCKSVFVGACECVFVCLHFYMKQKKKRKNCIHFMKSCYSFSWDATTTNFPSKSKHLLLLKLVSLKPHHVIVVCRILRQTAGASVGCWLSLKFSQEMVWWVKYELCVSESLCVSHLNILPFSMSLYVCQFSVVPGYNFADLPLCIADLKASKLFVCVLSCVWKYTFMNTNVYEI